MSLQHHQHLEESILPQHLFVFTRLKAMKVEETNGFAEDFSGIPTDQLREDEKCFFRETTHPQDYPQFLKHLRHLQDKEMSETTALSLRLKDKEGNWEAFSFRSRLYQYENTSSDPVVLSVGLPEKSQIPFYPENIGVKEEYAYVTEFMDEGYSLMEVIFDPKGDPFDVYFLRSNPALEKFFRLKEIAGKTLKELWPSADSEWLQNFGKTALSGETLEFETGPKNPWNARLHIKCFKVGADRSSCIIALFQDTGIKILTEKNYLEKKSELERNAILQKVELQENQGLLQMVFDTTNLAILVLETQYNEDGSIRDFIILKTNQVLREMYRQKDLIGASFLETSKYALEMGIFDAYKHTIETGAPFDREFYLNKRTLNNWFRVTARAQNDLLITTIEDITQRKEKDKELKETIRFKDQLVRTSPETILILNLNSLTIRYINKDIFKEGGITRERLQGMPLQEMIPYIHPRDRERVMEFHRKVVKSSDEEVHDLEIRLKLKTIFWEWFSVRGKVFHRRDESWVDEYVILVRNIHEQKKTQHALLKAEKLSIQGEVARIFAHELRNPLASMGMATQVISKKLGDQKPKFENYLQILSRSTKTLNELVSNLLNSTNYKPAVLKKMDLAQILDETLARAGDRIFLSGIQVIKKFEGPYAIYADKEKLMIALLNIILNASEATPPEKGILELEVLEDHMDFILRITDNGHGMESGEISRLFDAFYTNKDTGVGVGLSSVKNILEEHDAKIKVWSKPGQGTRFTLYFQNADLE